MRRICTLLALCLSVLFIAPGRAAADVTGFFGVSTTGASRPATGAAVAVGAVFVSFEFEYAHSSDSTIANTPGVGSGMFNLMLSTPTKLKIYVTAGGGLTHETLGAAGRWGVGTNIGGGVKIPLAGPIRLRIDYRVFTLHNTIPGSSHGVQQRIYAGINVAF